MHVLWRSYVESSFGVQPAVHEEFVRERGRASRCPTSDASSAWSAMGMTRMTRMTI